MCKITEAVQAISGASFIGLDIQTKPKVRKTMDTENGRVPNPHFDKIKKINTGLSGMVFGNSKSNAYDSMVKRRLEQENINPEDFKLQPRTWGNRIPNTPLVEHKGKMYLEVIVQNPGQVEFRKDNAPIDKGDIIGLPKSSKPSQAGLENKVIVRSIAIENIYAMRIEGKTITA